MSIEFIAGGIGSMFTMLILVPTDLLKCRAQMTVDGKLNYQAEVRNVISEHGYRGLYRGFWATFWRDVPNWGVYFLVFRWLE